MVQIIPAILAKTPDEFQKDLDKIQFSHIFDGGWVHIDFTDNKFVPNQTIGPEILKKYPTNLKIEAHLMVETPNIWTQALKDSQVKRIIAHIETGTLVIDDFISQCKLADIEVGLAIKMETNIRKLQQYFEVVDLILVMSIEPGFQGQPFISNSIERIRQLKSICSNFDKPFIIGVDGHVDSENINSLVEVGAEHLVIGSHLLKGDIRKNVEKIKEALRL